MLEKIRDMILNLHNYSILNVFSNKIVYKVHRTGNKLLYKLALIEQHLIIIYF